MVKRLWLALAIVVLLAGESRAEKKAVSFNAPDGFTLKGTFYTTGKAGPGVLLLHQCNGDHQVYDNLSTLLSTAGYNVLAFDFRGLGQSKGGEFTNFAAQNRRIAELMPGDVDAALKFMTSQNVVNPNALGIIGGDCGVNQAVHAAERNPTVRTLVLMSGGTDAGGEAFIKNSPKIPILAIASEEDREGAAAVKRVVDSSMNAYTRLEMFKNAGQAASIFQKEPDLEADIVIWFRSNLAIGGYGLPPTIK
jgi:dienelactone hydrolase